MHWTSREEKEIIIEWAREEIKPEYVEEYLPQPEKSSESYWNVYDSFSDIQEYYFDTIPELRQILMKSLCEDYYQNLIQPLCVAAFKGKAALEESETTVKESDTMSSDNQLTIPEFVYVF